jgi:hypothetical protein
MSRVAGDSWYHITNRANFRLNPKYAPRDNSISIEDRSGRSGIYLARDIEPWLNGHGYWRPFVAEFDVDPTVRDDPGVHGRWGGEMFVPAASFDKLHLKRVIPLDAWARERYGLFGWVEEQVGRRFDTGDAIQFGPGRRPIDPPRGYRYPGPDVRQMSPGDLTRLKSDFREFRRTRTAATVTVDKAHIDALRKDVLMIARAADNVASLGDIDQVTRAVRAWRDRWDTFASTLRQDLEDRVRAANNPYSTKYNANLPVKEDAEYYLNSALSPMWEFNTELNRNPRMDTDLKDVYGNPWKPPEEAFEETVRVYLEHGNAKSREDAIREAQRYHERRPLATRAEAEAAVVARWKDEAVKWTRRLRDKARKAWDTLNRYVEWLEGWRGGKRPLEVIHPDEEVVPLAGFRVIFRGFAESPYKDELEALRVGLERYRKAAAARAPLLLKMTPPIFIEWTFEPTSSSDAAAYYTHNQVNITPWVIGKDIDRFVKTLAHEVGHHLFRMYLAKDAMDAWAQFIRNDYRDLDLREALAVMDRVGAKSIIDESLMREDPILHIQLSTLMNDAGYSRVADWLFASGIRKYLDAGGNPIIRVPTNPITGYAGKNSDEAFCEALGNLVGYGPKAVPDAVLKMLRSVLGDGVRIASTRVAWAGGACNPSALSTAWVTPDGDVIPVPPGQTHSEWAGTHLADDADYRAQRLGPAKYLTDMLGWVRMANAYAMEVGPRGASDRAMQAVVGILVDCVLARRDIDPEVDLVFLDRVGPRLHPFTVAEFVAAFGTRRQSDAMYEGMLSRRWGRTAASRPKYQGKKEVPKADGSGTTTVYRYGPRQVANRHRDKAERIEGLRKSIGDLRRRVKADLKSDDAETRLTALAVALIDATYERVGNDESADNGHYGVTGWTMDHVTLSKDGRRVTFRYTGKSGVDHEKTVRDPDIVAVIKACCSDKGDDDHVLSDGDVRVTPRMVNDYLRGFDVTAKDLRGFHANREMQERLRSIRRDGPELPRPRKERDAILKGEFREALDATAGAVGHEPSTLRNQYLVPWLEDAYMMDGTVIDRLDKRATLDPRTATKTEAEREDDEVERLVRRPPKLKPSRDDSKRERLRVSDPDTGDRDRDLSLNHKDNG